MADYSLIIFSISLAIFWGVGLWGLHQSKKEDLCVYRRSTASSKTITRKIPPPAQTATSPTNKSIGTTMKYAELRNARKHTPVAQYVRLYTLFLAFMFGYFRERANMLTRQVAMHSTETTVRKEMRNWKYHCCKFAPQEYAVSNFRGLIMKLGLWTTSTSPANSIAPKNPTIWMAFL